MLKKWKEKHGLNATYRNLLRLCCDGRDLCSAETICEVLKEKAQERYVFTKCVANSFIVMPF